MRERSEQALVTRLKERERGTCSKRIQAEYHQIFVVTNGQAPSPWAWAWARRIAARSAHAVESNSIMLSAFELFNRVLENQFHSSYEFQFCIFEHKGLFLKAR